MELKSWKTKEGENKYLLEILDSDLEKIEISKEDDQFFWLASKNGKLSDKLEALAHLVRLIENENTN